MSNFPRQVRVIESDNYWGHSFQIGEIITALAPYDAEAGAINGEGTGNTDEFFPATGEKYEQVLRSKDYEELEVESTPVQSDEQKEVAARVKYLYSVQDESGYPILNTRDREYAREFKADLGGKKEGIIIMAYAPVKEIR